MIMRNMKKSFALILSLIILAGCSDNTRKTPSGMRFKIIRQGDGKLARVGEVIVFDYLLKDSRDSVWVSTYDTYPSAYIINDSSMIPQEGGIVQMLRMLSKGDSVVVNMSVNEFYRQATNERPRVIDPSLRMIYAFRVLDIMTNREYTEYQRNVMRVFNQRQMAKDKSAIDAFLASRNIRADTTENGIRYVITKPGEGPLAQSGQTVRVNYIGYLLNGQYFDTNLSEYAHQAGLFDPMRTYEPMEVTIDQSNVIAGWHEALKKLNKGAKGTFYIPSLLAYGGTGMGETIKPYSVLVFDIELVDFKEEKKAKKK
jgi:FKBP-type peptidyl-prolyl cis-trans isomerase FkpA